MVTEAFELIDRFEKAVDANGYRTRDKHTEEEYRAAKSALEAALSAAEPVAELQSIDARELDEAIQLLPSVMRPSLSKVIIAAIEEQRRIIAYFKRISRARQLAFEAATTPPAPSVAKSLESLCAWLLHRFGPNSTEGREASWRMSALSAQVQDVAGLTQDVIDLVIAAREFWDIHNDMERESNALDKALEKFASRVPFEDANLIDPAAPAKQEGA